MFSWKVVLENCMKTKFSSFSWSSFLFSFSHFIEIWDKIERERDECRMEQIKETQNIAGMLCIKDTGRHV